jgi:hypothetical protein
MLRAVRRGIASMLSRVVLRVLHDQRIERRIYEIVTAPHSFHGSPGNLEAELWRRATRQTAQYIEQQMNDVPGFDWRFDLMRHALARAGAGLYLEFGVQGGKSINFIADQVRTVVHGFDSFHGLPEDWTDREGKGAMTTDGGLPAVRHQTKPPS